MKVKKFIKGFLQALALLSVLLLMLVVLHVAVVTIAFPNRLPSFFGYSGSIVVSGSMEPAISMGDMVICKEELTYRLNDVIAYYDEVDGVFILHRIIGEHEEGFITKGDYNPEADPVVVQPASIQGRVIYEISNAKTYRDIALGVLLTLLAEYMIGCAKVRFGRGLRKGARDT